MQKDKTQAQKNNLKNNSQKKSIKKLRKQNLKTKNTCRDNGLWGFGEGVVDSDEGLCDSEPSAELLDSASDDLSKLPLP